MNPTGVETSERWAEESQTQSEVRATSLPHSAFPIGGRTTSAGRSTVDGRTSPRVLRPHHSEHQERPTANSPIHMSTVIATGSRQGRSNSVSQSFHLTSLFREYDAMYLPGPGPAVRPGTQTCIKARVPRFIVERVVKRQRAGPWIEDEHEQARFVVARNGKAAGSGIVTGPMRRHCTVQNNPGHLLRAARSKAEMRKLLNRKIVEQNRQCTICQVVFTNYSGIVPDHIDPRRMGGARRDDPGMTLGLLEGLPA